MAEIAPMTIADRTTVTTATTTGRTYTRRPRRRRPEKRGVYRGIFSSSICGLFDMPHFHDDDDNGLPATTTTFPKSDACAFACCGIWLWERNQYLLEKKTPKSWRERKMVVSFVVISIVLCLLYFVLIVPRNNRILGSITLFWIVFGAFYLLFTFQGARARLRLALAKETYAREHQHVYQGTEGQLDSYLQQNQREIRGSHGLCGCARVDVLPRSGRATMEQEHDEVEYEEDDFIQEDFCTKLWRMIACLCCGGCCCHCWIQCCGICAIAQEHRHLKRILPSPRDHPDYKDLWQRDYVTLQPWSDYVPKFQQVRELRRGNILAHIRAMSQLSSRLAIGVIMVLLLVLIVTFLPLSIISRWQYLVVGYRRKKENKKAQTVSNPLGSFLFRFRCCKILFLACVIAVGNLGTTHFDFILCVLVMESV